jgi:uncharacterized membrane protein
MLAWLSVLRYLGYNAGMLDLGNMTQAIASVLRGRPLEFTFQQGTTSRLAFHVEFFYLLLALPYALWPDPRTLVIIQAALMASAAIPVYQIALRRLEHPWAALAAALIYLLYPVAQTAVLFDLHGDTLAMPLLLWAVDAYERRAWRSYVLWIALALSCKFYVAVPVAALGFVIWRWGNAPRAGLLTMLAGLLYGAVAFLIIRPLFTTGETSTVHRGFNYISFYFGQWDLLLQTLPTRITSAIIVLGPVLLLAIRGWRWLLPGLPLVAAVLFSTGPGSSYDYRYHHYALAVPFLVLAVIDGAARLAHQATTPQRPGARPPRNWRTDLGFTTLVVALAWVVFVDTPANPRFWMGLPGFGLDSSVYGQTSRDPIKTAFLTEHVRPDEELVASIFVAPHVANRATLYSLRYGDDPGGERLPSILPLVDAAIADALFDWRIPIDDSFAGGAAYEQIEIGILLRDPSFGLVAARDGMLLFRRDAPAEARLEQTITLLPDDGRPAMAQFDTLELVAAQLVPLDAHRYQAAFTWRRIGDPPPMVAVSRLAGLADARIVHLPSYALLPPSAWPQDQLVREQMIVALPTDRLPGSYMWQLGWYDLRHSEAYLSDAQSRIGAEYALETLTISGSGVGGDETANINQQEPAWFNRLGMIDLHRDSKELR